jgi:hypothetical protein
VRVALARVAPLFRISNFARLQLLALSHLRTTASNYISRIQFAALLLPHDPHITPRTTVKSHLRNLQQRPRCPQDFCSRLPYQKTHWTFDPPKLGALSVNITRIIKSLPTTARRLGSIPSHFLAPAFEVTRSSLARYRLRSTSAWYAAFKRS